MASVSPRIQWLSTTLSRVAAPGASPSQRVSRPTTAKIGSTCRAHVGRTRRDHDELGLLGRLLGAQHGRVDVGHVALGRQRGQALGALQPDRAHLRPHRHAAHVLHRRGHRVGCRRAWSRARRRPRPPRPGWRRRSRRARPAAAPSRACGSRPRTVRPASARLRAIGKPMIPVPRNAMVVTETVLPMRERSYTASPMATGEHAREFPLFPLGIVALPSELVPLHIFEDRYKADGRRVPRVGSRVRDRLALGRGPAPDRLRLRDHRGAREARGRPHEHRHPRHPAVPGGRAPGAPGLPRGRGRVPARPQRGRRRVGAPRTPAAPTRELVERATDRRPEEGELAEMGAYEMAATVEFGLEAKQGLLDLRSENARLRLITRLFRAAAKRLDFVERAQDRAPLQRQSPLRLGHGSGPLPRRGSSRARARRSPRTQAACATKTGASAAGGRRGWRRRARSPGAGPWPWSAAASCPRR